MGEVINCAQYGLEAEDFELAMEALSYSILHIAKMNACATPEAFQVTFEKTTIKPDFAEAFFGAIKGSI